MSQLESMHTWWHKKANTGVGESNNKGVTRREGGESTKNGNNGTGMRVENNNVM